MVSTSAQWVLLAIAAALTVFGIASVLRAGAGRFEQAGCRRRNWILLMLVIGPLAVLLYFATVRNQVFHPERYRSVGGVAPADR
ncbi:MAG TPA: hypothetical protein DEP66_03335 [Acidimicrobiaceae bacterium]|nr:hypothetical protein [Acidimicrobiaceae bacterium]HCB37250.1 hypothetical protein [Acidimicrobiaceae bacterium]